MKPYDTKALVLATNRLLEDVYHMGETGDADTMHVSGNDNKKPYYELLEKRARALSSILKAGSDLLDFNDKMAKRNDDQKYTRLEDLPPLCPEDEARLKAQFYSLAERVSDARGPR